MKNYPAISSIILGTLLLFGVSSSAYALDYQGRSLKLGSKGNDVEALQNCLVSMGFSLDTDGWFGKTTHDLVANFQQSKGLNGDGIVGPYTSRLLDCGTGGESIKKSVASKNTNAVVARSDEQSPNDTAIFSYKLKLSPFNKAIYVPFVPKAAVKVLVNDPTKGIVVDALQKLDISSTAPVVTGTDGNDYYQVATTQTFTVTASIKPGKGSYQSSLDYVSFTSQDVLAKDYRGFMGVSLPLDKMVWTTKTITLD